MWWNRLKDRQQFGLILLAIATVTAIAAALLRSEVLAQISAALMLVGVVLSLT